MTGRPLPGLASNLPRGADDLARRVENLERALREGLAARAAEATSIANGATLLRDATDSVTLVALGTDPETGDRGVTVKAGGEVTVRDGGRLRVLTPDGSQAVVVLGRLDGFPKPQNGFALVAQGPSGPYTVLDLADYSTDGLPLHQVLSIRDSMGNPVVAPDALSGKGLAQPHLGFFAGHGDTNVATWPATVATTDTVIWRNGWELQNPFVSWIAQVYAPAGATAVHTLTWETQVLDTVTVSGGTSGTFFDWIGKQQLNGDVYSRDYLTVTARITAGAGSTAFQWFDLQGDQS